MQFAFDTLYIILIIAGIVWWTRKGRHLAARYVWPRWFWASFLGWMFGLLLTLTVVAWARSALTALAFTVHP